MNHKRIQSEVVVLRSLQMRHSTHCPVTVAIDEQGDLLIDVRMALVDPDVLIDRLNADGIELYQRQDCALVPLKWVKTLLVNTPSLVSAIGTVEQTVGKCFQSFPGSYLSYRPITKVGLRHEY